ncbi:hypothetical protein IT415_02060, partial [bacterium]|nr:hypothetical protein [bacterium]
MPPASPQSNDAQKPVNPAAPTTPANPSGTAKPGEQPATIPNPKLQKIYGTPSLDPGASGPKPFTKKLILVGLVGAIIIVLFVAVPAILLSTNKKKVLPTESVSPSITTRPSVDASARTDISQRFFLRPPGAKAIAYDIGLTVPVSWEARFSTQPTGAYAWTDTYLLVALLSKFSALSSTNLNTPSNNYLALIDSTEWMGTNRGPISLSPEQKRASVNALNSVNDGNPGSAAGAQSLLLSNDPGGRQFVQPIITQDQKLRGITYLTLTKDGEYQPRQIVMLSGSISGRQVLLFGNYEVRDHYWAELSNL